MLESVLPNVAAVLILSVIGWLVVMALNRGKVRNAFILKALEKALSEPEIIEKDLKEMETKANKITNPTKRQSALDHTINLRERFQMLKENVEGIKKLTKKERNSLGGLIADSNVMEEELSKITDPVLRAEKKKEIQRVDDELKRLINSTPTL